jgi:hypothetical protein
MFFKKSKTVVVDMYTHRPEVLRHAQVQPAGANKPKWWKMLPSLPDDRTDLKNMKACAGFNDLYSRGFMMPMWSDVILEFGEIGKDWWEYKYADGVSDGTFHGEESRQGWVKDTEYQHMKFNSPWLAKTDEHIDFMYTNMAYENSDPLDWFVMNGILNFKHQSALNINIIAKREDKPKQLFFKFQQPIVMLVPLTDRKVVFRHHLVSQEEWLNIEAERNNQVTFQRKYYKKSKCPFGK